MYMFRRLLISGLSLVAVISCSRMETEEFVSGTFRAVIEPAVRSGETSEIAVDRAVLEVWNGQVREAHKEIAVTPGTGTIVFSDVQLAAGFDYDIYIWADTEGHYDLSSDIRTVHILSAATLYDGTVTGKDAFYCCTTVHSRQGQDTYNVTMKRPFAQVDLILPETAASADITLSAPAAFDLKAGTVSETTQVSYTFDCQAKGTTTASDMLFAGKEVMSLSYSFKVTGAESATSFTVPVRQNYVTRIKSTTN